MQQYFLASSKPGTKRYSDNSTKNGRCERVYELIRSKHSEGENIAPVLFFLDHQFLEQTMC